MCDYKKGYLRSRHDRVEQRIREQRHERADGVLGAVVKDGIARVGSLAVREGALALRQCLL